MSKTFKTLDPEVIKDTTYWFWFCEGWSTATHAFRNLYRELEYDEYPFSSLIILALSPLWYVVGIPIAATFFKKQVLRIIEENGHVVMHNKKNIDYFTFMSTLQGRM